jgi:type VI secretion system protein ImpH
MPAAHGRKNQSVIGQLLDEPQRYEFFQAVRLAVQWFAEQGISAEQALARHIRFKNSLSMGFPASQIEKLEFSRHDGVRQLTITPTFMGMLGAHGALPAHFTERIVAWQASQQDEAPRAFLDMLSNRMLALFYEAWRKYRVEHAISDGTDRFKPLLLALAGFAEGSMLPGADGVRTEAIALYAGLLQQRPVSSIVLARILASYLGVGIVVEEMVDYWDVMARAEQSALGGANAALGASAVAGERCWRPDLHVRLTLGPLDRAAYERFLPGRPAAVALRKLLSLFGEPALVYEIALVLKAQEVQPARLSGALEAGARLGLDSFVVDGPATHARTDMRYAVRPLAPLRSNA